MVTLLLVQTAIMESSSNAYSPVFVVIAIEALKQEIDFVIECELADLGQEIVFRLPGRYVALSDPHFGIILREFFLV